MKLHEAVFYIVDSVDIVDYMVKFYGLQFKRMGSRNLVSICPLHSDSDPSFTVTSSNQLWYCFGCKKGGNIVNFVEQHDKMNRLYAVKKIISDLSLTITVDDDSASDMMMMAMEHFVDVALTNKTFNDFFTSKGIINPHAFGVGYCDDFEKLNRKLLQAGYGVQQVWESFGSSETYNNSIIYPVFTQAGNVSYFIIRKEDGSYISGSKTIPSYVDNLLIGMDRFKETKNVLLVEGFNDWLSIVTRGYDCIEPADICLALGMNGLKINEETIQYLKSFGVENVYIWVDGDNAGWNFLAYVIEKYGQLFCKNAMNGYGLFLLGKDPDEKLMEGKINLSQATLLPLMMVNNSGVDRKKFNLIDRLLHSMKDYDSLTIEIVINQIASLTGFSYESLYDRFLTTLDKTHYDYYVEAMLVSCILQDDSLMAIHNITLDWFVSKAAKAVITLVESKKVNHITIKTEAPTWVLAYVDRLPAPDMLMVKDCISVMKEVFYSRNVMDVGKRLISGTVSIEDAVDSLVRVHNKFQSHEDMNSALFSSIMKNTIDRIMYGQGNVGFNLNFTGLWPVTNSVLVGIMKKKLIYLSGSTGHGKTNLALNWVHILSVLQNYKCLYFTGEMDDDEISNRIISIHTGISNYSLTCNKVGQTDAVKVLQMFSTMKLDNIIVNHGMNFTQIFNAIRYHKMKYDIDYVVIDYLQLIEPAKYMREMSRTLQLKEMTRRLKTEICQQLDMPVIVVAQLGDASLDDPLPQARRLAESKLIQSDADVTIAIKRKSSKEVDLDPSGGNVIMHIDKMRYNRSNTIIPVTFNDTNLLMLEVMSDFKNSQTSGA